MRYKVVFFGKNGSGKTQLNHRIASKKIDFQEVSLHTVSVDFLFREIDSYDAISLWDTTGDERFKEIYNVFYKGSDVGVFCVDLTEKINDKEIEESINEFRQFAPNAPIICVGTKSDSPKADQRGLEKIKSKEIFANFIITSAKNDNNVEELFALIRRHCEAKLLFSWKEAVAKLKEHLKAIPPNKSSLIDIELNTLSSVLLAKPQDSGVTPKDKAKAIENFTNNCKIILEGEHPKVLKTVLSVAIAAIVLTVTALIGFTIGLACSWWTGPGAFFTGLLSGYTAALAVASTSTVFGTVAGGIAAHGLFKTSKEMNAINKFTAEVSSFDTAVVL